MHSTSSPRLASAPPPIETGASGSLPDLNPPIGASSAVRPPSGSGSVAHSRVPSKPASQTSILGSRTMAEDPEPLNEAQAEEDEARDSLTELGGAGASEGQAPTEPERRLSISDLRTLDYLAGPSPFEGLVTPVGSPRLGPSDGDNDLERGGSKSDDDSIASLDEEESYEEGPYEEEEPWPSEPTGDHEADPLLSSSGDQAPFTNADGSRIVNRPIGSNSISFANDPRARPSSPTFSKRSPAHTVRHARRPHHGRRRAATSAQLSEQRFGKDMLGYDAESGRDPYTVYTFLPSHYGSLATSFPSHPRGGPLPEHTLRRRVRLFWLQLGSTLISTCFLIFIVLWALSDRFLRAYVSLLVSVLLFPFRGFKLKKVDYEWEDPKKWRGERVTREARYYAQQAGYDLVEQDVETKDGYILRVLKVIVPHKPEIHRKDGKGGFPVLIQHGLFQSAGSFITSEERSLAFWLAEHGGYQVYLGNNRGVFDMGHRTLRRSDPRFWDFNVKELALYDLPAMVDHVLADTGFSKVAYIGHSQGNATMFAALASGMLPDLGTKLSVFVALAPAVYAGPLTTGFPFGALKGMRWRTWRKVFGILDFIPLMRWSYDLVPSRPFGLLGYQMFAFLFGWTDAKWLKRRKAKMFRFTPSPVSSASVWWWTGYQGFSTRGCILDPKVPKWYDKRFPPLAIYHGGKDYLVLTPPLLDRLRDNEKDVEVIRVDLLEDGEHCDAFWAADAVEVTYWKLMEDIEKTRKRKGQANGVQASPAKLLWGGPSRAGPTPAATVDPTVRATDFAQGKSANGHPHGYGSFPPVANGLVMARTGTAI